MQCPELPFNDSGSPTHDALDADSRSRLTVASLRLAIAYSDEMAVPVRYRGSSGSPKKRKPTRSETLIETRFQEDVTTWLRLLELMLENLEPVQAWRFIEGSPHVDPVIHDVTQCDDFNVLLDYLARRRDTDKCGHEELGNLCSLLETCQHSIQAQLEAVPGAAR